jgi:hypothetical protein
MIILPRQAQDKHRESTQTRERGVFLLQQWSYQSWRWSPFVGPRAWRRLRSTQRTVGCWRSWTCRRSDAIGGGTHLPFSALSLVLGLSRACLGKVIILFFESGKPLHIYICVDACASCSFLSFPYVCPEPVLVKCSFLYINGSKSGDRIESFQTCMMMTYCQVESSQVGLRAVNVHVGVGGEETKNACWI